MKRWLDMHAHWGIARKGRQLVAGVILLVTTVGACAPPPMSVGVYADALDVATGSYIDESQALSVRFHTSVEEQIAILADSGEGDLMALATAVTSGEMLQYLVLLEDAMTRYGHVLDEMRPPVNLVGLHDDYLAAIESVRIALPLTRGKVAVADDLDGIQQAVTSSGFADGQFRLQSSCLALEAAVRDDGPGIDLGCTRPVTGA